MLLRCLLVCQVEEEDAGQSTNEKDYIKPAMVEVELQLSQDLSDDGAVLQRHAHAHQQHRGHKIHPL